MKKQEDC